MASTKDWAESVENVLGRMNVDPNTGLDAIEVENRLAQYGANALTENKSVSMIVLLIKQFKSLIMVLLTLAACVAFWFDDHAGGFAILIVIVINVVIAFSTEWSAVKAMAALSQLGETTARVRRGGQTHHIATSHLVPGDILLVEAGDVSPADCRIIDANVLEVDESSLTGESLPVTKYNEECDPDTLLAERSSMLYRGTSVTHGTGTAVITATGMDSEIGTIADLVANTRDEPTPLEKKLDTLAHKLIWVTLGITATVTVLGTMAGKELGLMIETGLALAVAAIPEGLPVVATIALARGMYRMAQKNALISRLASVETLGATGIICTDKTGTLTENRMSVARLLLPDEQLYIGESEHNSDYLPLQRKTISVGANRALVIGILCNNAEEATDTNRAGSDTPEFTGDPLEVALLQLGADMGFLRPTVISDQPRIREVSFDSTSKMMATIHQCEQGYRVAVKGAPEEVITACTQFFNNESCLTLDEEQRRHWLAENERLASEGLRVIAMAEKQVQDASAPAYEQLSLVGLIGLVDPPREDVRGAIEQCQAAGIKVIMMTGDQTETARHVGIAVSLLDEADEVLHGSKLLDSDTLDEDEEQRLLSIRAFSRVTPQQKLKLIEMHQRAGQIVAMTGDGVNDAPALKKADIGIAMGKRGTQVAREASEMVLQDDSFATIVTAVREGRIIFSNIRLFALYLLSCNVSEVMIVGLAVVIGGDLPLMPLQILFLNLVTDVFPALALGVSSGTTGLMRAKPRPAAQPLLGAKEWLFIVVHGAMMTISVLVAFWIARYQLGLTGDGPITVSFLTLALTQLWHVLNLRATGSGLINNEVSKNQFIWLALALCIFILVIAFVIPGLAQVLNLTNIGTHGWLLICIASVLPLIAGQITIYLRLPFTVKGEV